MNSAELARRLADEVLATSEDTTVLETTADLIRMECWNRRCAGMLKPRSEQKRHQHTAEQQAARDRMTEAFTRGLTQQPETD